MFNHGISKLSPLKKQAAIYTKSITIIQMFYMSTVLFFIKYVSQYNSISKSVQAATSWPSNWIFESAYQAEILAVVLLVGIVSSLLVALSPFYFFTRLCSFISTQLLVSYLLAISNYSHSKYGFAFLTFIFLFLPHISIQKRSKIFFRFKVIMSMYFAAASLLMVYFLVGIGNLSAGVQQFYNSEISIFHPSSVAYFVLGQIINDSTTSMFSDIVIKFYWLFWLGLFVILGKKLAAPLFICKIRYLPYAGLGFISFHILNGLLFNIPFQHFIFQLFLFLLINPINNCNRVIPNSWIYNCRKRVKVSAA
jgi:hypothetical protein